MQKNKVIYEPRVICNVCGSEKFLEMTEIEDFDTHLGVFKIVKCSCCGTYYTSPHPSEETLHFLYETRDSKNFDSNNSSIIEQLKDVFAKKQLKHYLKKIKINPKSFVDFGTGNGRYACNIKSLCPNCIITAVDFSTEMPDGLKNQDIKYLCVNDFFEDNKKYDVIFLRHVLEHSYNPVEFLKQFDEHLSENGVIIVEVPNVESGVSRLFGKYSSSYYPPYHLVHFTFNNMKNMLKKLDYDYTLCSDDMPLMSNNLANMCNRPLDNKFRLAGVIFHPIQILANLFAQSPTVITALIRIKKF